MTDLENREAFEKWHNKEYSDKLEWDSSKEEYKDYIDEAMWQTWKASAQRQGFKLVSVEPNSKHVEAFWHNFLVEQPNAQTMYFAYKAMINAV